MREEILDAIWDWIHGVKAAHESPHIVFTFKKWESVGTHGFFVDIDTPTSIARINFWNNGEYHAEAIALKTEKQLISDFAQVTAQTDFDAEFAKLFRVIGVPVSPPWGIKKIMRGLSQIALLLFLLLPLSFCVFLGVGGPEYVFVNRDYEIAHVETDIGTVGVRLAGSDRRIDDFKTERGAPYELLLWLENMKGEAQDACCVFLSSVALREDRGGDNANIMFASSGQAGEVVKASNGGRFFSFEFKDVNVPYVPYIADISLSVAGGRVVKVSIPIPPQYAETHENFLQLMMSQ